MMPDSCPSGSPRPNAVSCAAWVGSSCQLSFWMSKVPLDACSSRVGSASASGTPKGPRDGPIPRTATVWPPLCQWAHDPQPQQDQ